MNSLVKTALIGTAKHPTLDWDDSPELTQLLPESVPGAVEERLLLAAGASAIYQQAGRLPHAELSALPAVGATDTVARSVHLVPLFHQTIQSEKRELLIEFLTLLAQHQLHLPYELLPRALEQTDPAVRQKLQPVVGERGRWLSQWNPRWHWVTQGVNAISSQDQKALRRAWEEGKLPQRALALSVVRQTDAAEGRRWLEETLPQEKAEARATLLEQLQQGLSDEDEPLLEQLLDDRSDQVRQAAASLLRQLPASSFVQRMQGRAEAMLRFDGRKLSVIPPEELPQDWTRDGISAKVPAGRGKRAWWLEQVISAVPIIHWSTHFRKSPTELILALDQVPFGDDTVLGWTQAIQLVKEDSSARLQWAHALWSHWLLRWQQEKKPTAETLNKLALVLKLLPSGTAEQNLLPFLVMGRIDVSALLVLLDVLPRPWSIGFAQQYLKLARQVVKSSLLDQAYEWSKSLDIAAVALPATAFSAAQAQWDTERTGEKSWTAQALAHQVERFVQLIQLRRLLHEEIKSNRR